jgi:carbon storage regulator CsrA
MLVLSRKIEESVVVGDPDGVEEMVKVTVLSIARGRVRLGFEVAGDLPVFIAGKSGNASKTSVRTRRASASRCRLLHEPDRNTF